MVEGFRHFVKIGYCKNEIWVHIKIQPDSFRFTENKGAKLNYDSSLFKTIVSYSFQVENIK